MCVYMEREGEYTMLESHLDCVRVGFSLTGGSGRQENI
jgi:hypothetical protein